MAGVVVPIDGDISPILAQFAKLPGRTQAEMDAVGRVVQDEITRGRIAKGFADLPGVSQKAAKKAGAMLTREMQKASADSQKALGDLRRGAQSVFGGIVNDADDMAQALGALPPAMGGIAVALGIVAGAAIGLYKATEATGALAEEQAALSTAASDVVYQFGSVMPGAFESAILGMASLTTQASATATGLRGVLDISASLYDEFTTQAAISIGIGTSALAGNKEETQRWADAYYASRGYGAAVDDATTGTAEWLAQIKATKAALEYNKSGWQGPKMPTGSSGPRSGPSRPSAVAALLPSKDEAAEEAAAYETFLGDISRMQYVHLAEMNDAKAAAAAADKVRMQEEIALRDDTRSAYLGASSDIAGAVGDLSGLLLEQGGISKEAAQALIVVQKAAGIAQIGISTAVAVMNAFRDLPTPAAPFAAAGIIALGVAQAAVVAATPTTFHTGGLVRAPDEVGITARNGEGVLTAQGVDAIGGQAGLNRANRGEGGSGSITVVQQYQHRVFDAFVADNVRSDGPLRKAIRGKRRIGHAGRR